VIIRFRSTAVSVLALLVLGGLLTACGPSSPPAASSSLEATHTTPTPTPAPTIVAGDAVYDPPAAAPSSWVMPNLVGTGLQDAQDAIQHFTDYGIPITTSHDAGSADRMQVLDRDWKVCTQNVSPGAEITPDTRIDFGAVKLSEHC
jgi:hypothetical protein